VERFFHARGLTTRGMAELIPAALVLPDEDKIDAGKMTNRPHADHEAGSHYRLLGMIVLSFVAMYILMYAMVNSLANVYNNVN